MKAKKKKQELNYDLPHDTESDLRCLDHEALVWAYCLLQDRFEDLRDRLIPDLKEKYLVSRIRQYGRSSEKMSVLTSHAERSQVSETADNPTDSTPETRERPVRHTGCAAKVIQDLPVIDEQIELSPEELAGIFGEGVPYKDDPNFEKAYDVVCTLPVEHSIKRYHIHVYRSGKKIVPAIERVDKMKAGSLMSPEIMAEIVNDRCTLQLPMNRIAQEFKRCGFPLTRQTMARWCIDIGYRYIEPLILRMVDLQKAQKYLHADETFVTVGKTLSGERKECREWVFRTSPLSDVHQLIVFWFDETRSTEVLRELFGYVERLTIICDSYTSYDGFAEEMNGKVTIAHCYTHGRRNFTDILKAVPGFKNLSEEEQNSLLSCKAVKKIDRIFKMEREIRYCSAEERLAVRQEKGVRLVDDLFDLLKSVPEEDLDKSSELYKAVSYMTTREKQFRVFLNDGNVPVHNSSCEQAIIPFSIGRNNWKCIDSIDGAITLGYYHSVTETAKANGASPYYYLKFLFERLPVLFNSSGGSPNSEAFDELMPWTDTYRNYEKEEMGTLGRVLEAWTQAS